MPVRKGVCYECQTAQNLYLDQMWHYPELLVVRHINMNPPCLFPEFHVHPPCKGSFHTPQALIGVW